MLTREMDSHISNSTKGSLKQEREMPQQIEAHNLFFQLEK